MVRIAIFGHMVVAACAVGARTALIFVVNQPASQTILDSKWKCPILAMSDERQTDILDRLMAEIHTRAAQMPEGSYTTKLIRGGVEKMGAKITEEAAEVVDAAATSVAPDNQHLIYEACDVIYHLWVLLGSRGVTVDDLRAELARREGTSGLEEKRQRTPKS